MSLDKVVELAVSILVSLAVILFLERVVVKRIPEDMKEKLATDIVTRIVVFVSILGLIMLRKPVVSFVAILLGFVNLMAITNFMKKDKKGDDNKKPVDMVSLPINSNDIKEQEVVDKALEDAVESKKELVVEMKNNAPNKPEVEGKENTLEPIQDNLVVNTSSKQKYNSELALGDSLYLPNNELQRQNRAKVSREELEARFAIYLEGSEQFKHNDTSYARNDSKYVTGELLESGLPNNTDNCVSVQEMKEQEVAEGFANLPRRYFNDKSCKGDFTTKSQLEDAQSNLVDCDCDKKDTSITCLNKDIDSLYSAKRQYSSQGTSSDPMNPSGFNL